MCTITGSTNKFKCIKLQSQIGLSIDAHLTVDLFILIETLNSFIQSKSGVNIFFLPPRVILPLCMSLCLHNTIFLRIGFSCRLYHAKMYNLNVFFIEGGAKKTISTVLIECNLKSNLYLLAE